MVQTERFEILRSGFLRDGRYYSIEAVSKGMSQWQARLVCVPAGEELYLQEAALKQSLAGWAAELTEEEIEDLALRCR